MVTKATGSEAGTPATGKHPATLAEVEDARDFLCNPETTLLYAPRVHPFFSLLIQWHEVRLNPGSPPRAFWHSSFALPAPMCSRTLFIFSRRTSFRRYRARGEDVWTTLSPRQDCPRNARREHRAKPREIAEPRPRHRTGPTQCSRCRHR